MIIIHENNTSNWLCVTTCIRKKINNLHYTEAWYVACMSSLSQIDFSLPSRNSNTQVLDTSSAWNINHQFFREKYCPQNSKCLSSVLQCLFYKIFAITNSLLYNPNHSPIVAFSIRDSVPILFFLGQLVRILLKVINHSHWNRSCNQN